MVIATLALLITARPASSPIATVRQFVAAWNSGNLHAMAGLIAGADESNMRMMPTSNNIQLHIRRIRVKTKGNGATVYVTIMHKNLGKTYTRSERDRLIRVAGKWLIIPAKASDKDTDNLASLAALGVM